MKRNLVYIILGLIFFMGSCKKDEKLVDEFDANFVITNSNLTPLDNALKLKVVAYNVTEPIRVVHMGGKVSATGAATAAPANPDMGSITLVDGAGTIYIQDTQLGVNAIGRIFYLRLFGKDLKGIEFFRDITVTVATPFTTIIKPTVVLNDVVKNFQVWITPKISTIAPADVSVQMKVNKLGTYAAYPSVYGGKHGQHPDSLLVHITGTDFTVNDTVYFKVTATGKTTLTTFGDRTTTSTSTIVIAPWKYGSTATGKLTMGTKSYDLLKRRLATNVALGDSADMALTYTNYTGGFSVGFEANQNAEFVKVNPATAAAFYATGDVNAVNAVDFSSAVTSFDDVAVDDVYVFRTYRGSDDYTYGMFKIVTVGKPEGVQADSFIEFEVKY